MEISAVIIEQCMANERKAQKQLYLKLMPYLHAVINRYLRHKDLTKDVLQETFLQVFKNLHQYDTQKGPLLKWATRIAINNSLNYNNRVKFDDVSLEEDQHEVPVSASVLAELSNAELLTFLQKMPAAHYEVFNLYVIDGYTHDEIATLLGITTVLSRKRLSRARTWISKHQSQEESNGSRSRTSILSMALSTIL